MVTELKVCTPRDLTKIRKNTFPCDHDKFTSTSIAAATTCRHDRRWQGTCRHRGRRRGLRAPLPCLRPWLTPVQYLGATTYTRPRAATISPSRPAPSSSAATTGTSASFPTPMAQEKDGEDEERRGSGVHGVFTWPCSRGLKRRQSSRVRGLKQCRWVTRV